MTKMLKIKNPVPWLLALGFGLLYLSTFISSQDKAPQQSTLPSPKSQEHRPENAPVATEAAEGVSVTRVIDGDTIEITGGIRVRYIGIDTPEPGDCLGNEASLRNKQALEGKKVRLEKDIEKLDKYSRTLAYVFADGVFINEVLVKEGLATVTTYPPNVKYVDRFLAAQNKAKEQKLGVWADNPCPGLGNSGRDRDSQIQGAQTDCLIKGNISKSGEKIYHIPGQRYYEKTKIEESKGERWFCSEEEAVGAGWRKSKV